MHYFLQLSLTSKCPCHWPDTCGLRPLLTQALSSTVTLMSLWNRWREYRTRTQVNQLKGELRFPSYLYSSTTWKKNVSRRDIGAESLERWSESAWLWRSALHVDATYRPNCFQCEQTQEQKKPLALEMGLLLQVWGTTVAVPWGAQVRPTASSLSSCITSVLAFGDTWRHQVWLCDRKLRKETLACTLPTLKQPKSG